MADCHLLIPCCCNLPSSILLLHLSFINFFLLFSSHITNTLCANPNEPAPEGASPPFLLAPPSSTSLPSLPTSLLITSTRLLLPHFLGSIPGLLHNGLPHLLPSAVPHLPGGSNCLLPLRNLSNFPLAPRQQRLATLQCLQALYEGENSKDIKHGLFEEMVLQYCTYIVKVHGAPRPLTWRRDVTQRRRRDAKKLKENIPR